MPVHLLEVKHLDYMKIGCHLFQSTSGEHSRKCCSSCPRSQALFSLPCKLLVLQLLGRLSDEPKTGRFGVPAARVAESQHGSSRRGTMPAITLWYDRMIGRGAARQRLSPSCHRFGPVISAVLRPEAAVGGGARICGHRLLIGPRLGPHRPPPSLRGGGRKAVRGREAGRLTDYGAHLISPS